MVLSFLVEVTVCVYANMRTRVDHWYMCRGQKTTCKSWFSSPIMHALGIYLRLWGLVTSPFTC